MKPLINHLSGIAIFMLFPLLFFWKKEKKIVIVFLLLLTVGITSCFQHYFKTGSQTSTDIATIQKLISMNKIFIIHFQNRLGELRNPAVINDKLESDIITVSPEHAKYLNPPAAKSNRVKKIDKANVLMEVHLYYPQEVSTDQTHLSIPLSAFNRIDVYEFDKSATVSNHVVSWIGIGVLTAAAVGLIALATVPILACNCPQVYIDNNGSYNFISGVYSGAVYSSLERTDYLPLPLPDQMNKTFSIKIKNVKDEEQFMNRIQLLEVNHPAGTNVLADRHGNVFSFNKPMVSFSATSNKDVDIKNQLAVTDDDQYLFDSEKDETGLSSTVLVFNKPKDYKKAKLIVHGGNSTWSGYLCHSFAELFGSGYEKWKKEKDQSDPEEMEKWQTGQGLPLMVYVEKNGKWVFADYFAHTGNTASRDMIMELDLPDTRTDQVRIKLETVYQFWNLDFAGIDYSANSFTATHLVDPSKALRSDGTDQTRSLSTVDKDYTHLNANEEISLEYQPDIVNEGTRTSYFLVSTGYYHNMKKYEGAPKIATLLKFKNKNAFDDFSREKFTDIQKCLSYVAQQKQ